MNEIYNKIQAEFDKHRVDEWHSVIPLSEDGASLLDDMEEVSEPNTLSGENGLFVHHNEQGFINPANSYTYTASTCLFEDNNYIYNVFAISGGCDHHEGHLVQLTRHDKQRKVDTGDCCELSSKYPHGVTEEANYYDENGL